MAQAGLRINPVFRELPQAKRGQLVIAKTRKDYRLSWTNSKPADFSDWKTASLLRVPRSGHFSKLSST
jgi:hypothetical protein